MVLYINMLVDMLTTLVYSSIILFSLFLHIQNVNIFKNIILFTLLLILFLHSKYKIATFDNSVI